MSALFLPDGSVVPSHRNVSTTNSRQAVSASIATNNPYLRRGYVCAKHYPKDKGYEERHNIVYDVLIYANQGSKGDIGTRVPNVELMVPLGSSADSFHATLRCPTSFAGGIVTQELIAQSTRVLVMFADGYSSRGVIVGCLPNQFDADETKDDGHNLIESFNGVKRIINNDGELILLFTGQTIDANNVEQPYDAAKGGTFVKLTKDGGVIISNADGDYFVIDRTNHTITTNSTQDIVIRAEGKTFIGSATASENLVLGAKLVAALNDLVKIVEGIKTTPFTTTPAIPGQPLMASADLKANLTAWLTTHATDVASSDLTAKDKFTEENTP